MPALSKATTAATRGLRWRPVIYLISHNHWRRYGLDICKVAAPIHPHLDFVSVVKRLGGWASVSHHILPGVTYTADVLQVGLILVTGVPQISEALSIVSYVARSPKPAMSGWSARDKIHLIGQSQRQDPSDRPEPETGSI
ncbi:hypothetical protein E2P81_ATG10695 [Venturia nashicola]|nr:hypothetical protein E2P81_ATG10695 [Venturia nashicola]